MDPVSLCASILTVISAAQAVAKGLRKLKGSWQAPQLLQDITAEIDSLESTLHDISAFIASAHSLPNIQRLCEPVSRAALTIKKINFAISSPSLYTIRLRDSNYARVTWLCRKNEIKSLLDELKVVRLDLMVRLGLLATSSIARIEELLNVSLSIQSCDSKTWPTDISRNDQTNGIPQWTVQRPSRTLIQEDPPSFPNTSIGTEFEKLREATPKTNHDSENGLSQPASSPPAQSCPAWCGCKCHVRYRLKSPWIFDTVFGRVDVQYSREPTECNEIKCRRSVKSPFSIKYHFPQYLVNRYVVFKMHYSALDGPTFALRAPRVVEHTCLLWHYILRDDLAAVQKMFSEHKASPYDVDATGCNGSIFAVNHPHCRISQFLIQQGADPTLPNQRGPTASELLWDRAFAGHFGHESQSIVSGMLNDSDAMEGRDFSILHKIVLSLVNRDLRSELEVSTALLNRGDATQRTPLLWAVIRDDFEKVAILLAYGADPNIVNNLGYSPLHFVRSSKTCEALLNAGADISLRSTKYQKSPLHGACFNKPNVEVINALVKAGVPVDIHDADNETPLLRALYESSTAEAERFIELGANVNTVKTSSGKNPILIAVHRNLSSLVPPLLARGADYMATTVHGDNIAHLAAELADRDMFRILIDSHLYGLDMSLRNKQGKTPADFLAERDFFGDDDDQAAVYDAFEALSRSVTPIGPVRPVVVEATTTTMSVSLPGGWPA